MYTAAPGGAAYAPRPSGRGFLRSLILFVAAILLFRVVATHFGLLAGLVFLLVAARAGALRLVPHLLSLVLASHTPNGAYREALRRADTMHAPITEKISSSGASERLTYGFSCMQGWRRAMEDAHICQLIDGRSATGSGDRNVVLPSGGFFSVFDGHCGSSIAQFCGSNLLSFVVSTPGYHARDYRAALVQGYVSIDKHLQASETFRTDRSGCTAITVWIVENELYCANAGDSRAILCRGGAVMALSVDHKPNLADEQRRIEKAGSMVRNKRVNGVLALSRAIGDFSFKQNWMIGWEEQAVTSVPDVVHVTLGPRDQFIVLACDGIWDVMSNEQVVAFVSARIAKGINLSTICEHLMQNCLSPHPFGLGCDNMSVIIITFNGSNVSGSGHATTAAAAGDDPSS